MIKGKTPEEIRKTFNIKNDFTPEEEEEVRRENQWAFEWFVKLIKSKAKICHVDLCLCLLSEIFRVDLPMLYTRLFYISD